jgi:DNA-binding NarL/FixJ family response regulator
LRSTAVFAIEPESTDRAKKLVPLARVERAARRAASRFAQNALHDALVRIEAACSEKGDTERSARLRRRLARGGWLLVEVFERDGRRYCLVQKSPLAQKRGIALTRREREILGYAELGFSNKVIAHALAVSPSTIANVLHKAQKKLGHNFR